MKYQANPLAGYTCQNCGWLNQSHNGCPECFWHGHYQSGLISRRGPFKKIDKEPIDIMYEYVVSSMVYEEIVSCPKHGQFTVYVKTPLYKDNGDKQNLNKVKTFTALNNQMTAGDYYTRGNKNVDLKNYQEALEDFTRVIKLDPEDASAYYNHGLSNKFLKNYSDALEDYTRAIELAPEYSAPYSARGNAYIYMGNYSSAIPDFIKATELDPKESSSYFNLAISYSYLGNAELACQWLRKAIFLDSKFIKMVDEYPSFGLISDSQEYLDLVNELMDND